jgi:hypothetical protein
MRLRYERGAYADLEEILLTLLPTVRLPQLILLHVLKMRQGGLRQRRTLGRQQTIPGSDAFQLANI